MLELQYRPQFLESEKMCAVMGIMCHSRLIHSVLGALCKVFEGLWHTYTCKRKFAMAQPATCHSPRFVWNYVERVNM